MVPAHQSEERIPGARPPLSSSAHAAVAAGPRTD